MIFFIVHWRLCLYSSYFVTILSRLKKDYKITLIDCYDNTKEDDLESLPSNYDSVLYDCLLRVTPATCIDKIKEMVLGQKEDWNLVISNSMRNNSSPGKEIAQMLECQHFLFEHLGCFVEEGVKVEPEVASFISKFHQVIVPSEVMQEAFAKLVPKEKVHVSYLLPLGEYFTRPLGDVTQKQRRLLYAGKFLHAKGIFEFLKINATFFEKEKISLLLVGSGVDDKELREVADKFPFVNIKYPVSPYDLISLIDTSMGVVVPSKTESYSMIVVESLLRGTPVFCHNTGIAKTLKGMVPGVFSLNHDQSINQSSWPDFLTFDEHLKLRKMMKMFLRLKNDNLFSLIEKDHAAN